VSQQVLRAILLRLLSEEEQSLHKI